MVITLIGYRGSGKTSVARQLAQTLRLDWLDTDDLVESAAGKSIRQVFDEDGEDEFRRLEQQAIHQATQRDSLVIAAGGGAILREDNREAMRAAGPVVWLQASATILAQRIGDDAQTAARRPSLTDQSAVDEVVAVLAKRLPLYAAAATHTVDTEGLLPEEVAEEIRKQLECPETSF